MGYVAFFLHVNLIPGYIGGAKPLNIISLHSLNNIFKGVQTY